MCEILEGQVSIFDLEERECKSMKRFEQFNRMFKTSQTAEEQAYETTLSSAAIGELKDKEMFDKKYEALLNWLNEEVK